MVAILLSAFVAVETAAATAATPHVLRFATAEEVATLNPDLSQQLVVSYLSQMTAAYAFRTDAGNRLIPELATSVPTEANGGISKDGMTITLHLRRGVKWSDGAPFDGSDVAFTIAAINNSANVVPTRAGFDQIARIDEPDPLTVVLHLKAPFGAIVPTLFASSGIFAILPKHVLGTLHDMNTAPFNSLPVGIGPFRYAAWKRGDEIELERNPNYWRGQAALDRVIMKLIPDRNTVLTQLQTGELDVWYPFGGSYLSRVAAIPGIHLIRQPAYSVNEVALNLKSPMLVDRSVRQAMRYGLNRAVLRDKVGHGVGILQDVVFPTIDPSTPKDIPFTAYAPDRANAILDAAGWKRGADGIRQKNGQRLSLAVATSAGTPDADVQIELIRSWWQPIGIAMDVRRYQSSLLFGPYNEGGIFETGKFDVMFLGRSFPAPFDITSLFGCSHFPPAGQNEERYCNPKFDAIAAEYDRTYDDGTRAKLLDRAAHILEADVPVIVTVGREDLFGVSNAVKNFHPHAAAPFDDMLKVDVVP